MFKKLILSTLFVLWVVSSSTIVFGTDLIFSTQIRVNTLISPNIYLGDKKLSQTVIGYESTTDLKNAQVQSSCALDSRYLWKYNSVYYFLVSFTWEVCKDNFLTLHNKGENIPEASQKLNIVSYRDIFNILTDYPTSNIQSFYASLNDVLQKNSMYKTFDTQNIETYMSLRKKQRKYEEALYQAEIVQQILSGRLKKYISPVIWKDLPRTYSKIPNSGRPYRESYTDGIHHGWDIDWNLWDEIVALDDGMIVRIVNGFQFTDLSRIEYWENLSYEQELKNLDILRGNQVWLKTTKGEIVFYSHLDNVYDYLEEGDMVERGTPLGTMGSTGVPEEWYDDYHLHFEIQVNPYNPENAGKYNFEDYLKWDWKFKGESFEYILKNQAEIFE